MHELIVSILTVWDIFSFTVWAIVSFTAWDISSVSGTGIFLSDTDLRKIILSAVKNFSPAAYIPEASISVSAPSTYFGVMTV